jgi:hypothetical protein
MVGTLNESFGVALWFIGVVTPCLASSSNFQDLDHSVRVVEEGTLVFPALYGGMSFEGFVLFWTTISPEGIPERLEILEANHPVFLDKAINFLLDCRFTSPTFEGQKVVTKIPISVRFPAEEGIFGYEEYVDCQVRYRDELGTEEIADLHFKPGYVEFKAIKKDNLSELEPGPFVLPGPALDTELSVQNVLGNALGIPNSVRKGPFPYDQRPEPTRLILPVTPFSKAVQSAKPKAVKVSFMIDPEGIPFDPQAETMKNPDLEYAAEAAIRYFRFLPATYKGEVTTTGIAINLGFDRFNLSASERKLARKLNRGDIDFFKPSQLDIPLNLRVIQPIHFPRLPEKSGGYAVLEIHIDPKGEVFFPEIIETDNQDLAWSVLTAISQWRFDPPLVDGKPVHTQFRQKFENSASN